MLLHDLDIRNDPVLGDSLSHVGSALCHPIYHGGVPTYWNIAFRVAKLAASRAEFMLTTLPGA